MDSPTEWDWRTFGQPIININLFSKTIRIPDSEHYAIVHVPMVVLRKYLCPAIGFYLKNIIRH